MTFQQIRQRADQLRAIPLESVLRVWGAHPDRFDKRKWHTPQGALSVAGTKFMNWNSGVGGGGAIDLVVHLNQLGFKDAVQWLWQHFPSSASTQIAQPLPKPTLTLPPPDPSKLQPVKHYLVDQRGIAQALIDPLIQSGTLYADYRTNAVFLLLGKQNSPVGAELRGTTPRHWRGMAPGSQKDLGFFSIPAAPLQTIVLCESAIDAISCFALHPHLRCISTAGARPNPRWLASLVNQGHQLYCGFDADPTGDSKAQAMIALHPTIKRLRPSQHDWNDVLTSPA
jgi:hypothetical protein